MEKSKVELISKKNQDGSYTVMKVDSSDSFYRIDGIAANVWGKLNDGHDLDQIESEILMQYKVEKEILKKDLTGFVQELKKRDLI